MKSLGKADKKEELFLFLCFFSSFPIGQVVAFGDFFKNKQKEKERHLSELATGYEKESEGTYGYTNSTRISPASTCATLFSFLQEEIVAISMGLPK